MSKSTGSFISFLVGVLVGGITGILYAPDKGKNTRDKLSYQLGKLKKQLEDFIDNKFDESCFDENEAKMKANTVVKETKGKAKGLLDDVNDLIDEITK